MKIAFSTMGTPGLALNECTELAIKYGFSGIDIRCHHNKGEVQVTDNKERLDEVACFFKQKELSIPCLKCYNTWPDESGGNWISAEDELCRLFEIAELLNSPAIRIFPRIPKDNNDLCAYIDNVIKLFNNAFEKNRSDIKVYLQNHKGSLNARETANLCRLVNSCRLGMVYSPDHVYLMNESYQGILDEIFPFIMEVYVADAANGKVGVLPGSGEAHLAETINYLESHNFNGFYTFKWEKIWHPELADAIEVFPVFVDYMKQFKQS